MPLKQPQARYLVCKEKHGWSGGAPAAWSQAGHTHIVEGHVDPCNLIQQNPPPHPPAALSRGGAHTASVVLCCKAADKQRRGVVALSPHLEAPISNLHRRRRH